MSGSNLVLTAPVIIDHDWQYCWFDCAHQHSLLLNDAYFYTLSFEDKNPTPNLFYHQEELPKKLVLAKVSLDMKIIAVQTTLVSILVIDTTNKKKWVVEIKNPNDNNILPNGIIWSDHGGNSQDLIIVTARGIELYKISQMRGQCKLSRFINQPGFTFWYEPSHRLIMMASVQKTVASPSGAYADKKLNDILLMDGYFLKYERSNMPLLELPPPDKAPRFELGPGVVSENIALHSLYGKLCCLVHFTGGDGTDFITVYYVTKLSVERAHCLAFNCSTSTLKYSVFDNVLICHSYSLKQSFLFDILSTNKKLGLVSETREAIEPVCGPSAICVEEVINGIEYGAIASDIKKPVALKAQSGVFSDSDSSGNSSLSAEEAPKVPNIILKIIDPPGGTPDGKTGIAGAAAASAAPLGGEEEESEWNTIHGSQQRISLIQTANQQGGAAALAAAAVGMRRSIGPAGTTASAGNIKKPDSLTFAGTLSAYRLTSSTNINNATPYSSSHNSLTRKTAAASTSTAKLTAAETSSGGRTKRLTVPVCLQELYDSSKFEHHYVNLVYDKVNKVVYRLSISFPSIVKGSGSAHDGSNGVVLTQSQLNYDPRESVYFLTRRGQLYAHYFNKPFQAAYRDNASADRLLDYTHVSESARICKHLLLYKLYLAIEERSPLSWLEDFVAALMQPYINEYRRQIKMIYDEDNRNAINNLLNGGSGSAGGGGAGGGGGTYVVSSKETAFGMLRRKTLSDGGVFGKNRRGSTSGGPSEATDCFQLEAEPLEALSSALSFTTYLPDISKTGMKAKTLLENPSGLNNSNNSINNSSGSSIAVEGLSFVPLPLSTRRDINGSLIVSQNEIIAYVWLPLFLNASTNEEMTSLTWSLEGFIATFRELDMPILPALSILLMNVLFYRNRYMEMAKLVQLNFFPDSTDVAMASLEFRDILEDWHNSSVNNSGSSSIKSKGPNESMVRLQMQSAMQILQQAGIDMLHRLDEKVTLVLWHLGHARIVEAVMMCTKKSGLWRAGLPPGCISGIEFFNSAMKAIENLDNTSDFENDLKRINGQIAENRRLDALEREEQQKERELSRGSPSRDSLLRGRTSSSSSIASTSSDGRVRIVEYVVRDTFLNQQSDALLCKRVDILILVYNFIKEWDNSVLLASSNLVKSKLAVQSQFPDHLFDSVTAKRFRDLFGFV